jgi:hypothetical protein
VRRGALPDHTLTPARLLVAVAATMALVVSAPSAAPADLRVPERLSDAQFSRLMTEFSEGDGYFASDNLVSNELTFQWVIPDLLKSWSDGRAYLGVGPDQNFTYIANLRPSIAFIVDIRRDNLRLHLLYKALMEMSPTRAAFLSRLLSRELTTPVATDASAARLFQAFAEVKPTVDRFAATFNAVKERLTVQHGLTLSQEDLGHIEYVLTAFFYAGPALAYANTGFRGRYPSYQDLMVSTDESGEARSYLADEQRYAVVRTMQLRNLIIPVVGDFTGDRALRAVGQWIKDHGATIGAIYTSNVEQYLFQYQTWPRYYENVATLPVDGASQFIRSCFNTCSSVPWSRSAQLLDPVTALLRDIAAGKLQTYWELLARSR